jgi:hypothetical protein
MRRVPQWPPSPRRSASDQRRQSATEGTGADDLREAEHLATAPDPVRLLDRALAAHGRDHGYRVAAWCEHALAGAHAIAGAVSGADVEAMPLSRVVLEAVDAVAGVVVALHRDRLAVPSGLADAIGSMLVLHVATAGEVG